MLTYTALYVAIVTETGLDSDGKSSSTGRYVKARCDFFHPEAGVLAPANDGLMKLRPPEVDDRVLVMQADASNRWRWYVPIRDMFTSLTDDNTRTQIESVGGLDIEGTEIKLGTGATEPAVLGSTLEDILGQLIDALVVENHFTAAGASSPPLNSATYTALKAQLFTFKSQKVKIE